MKLNYITNESKNLQEKMRFFSDYFSFANDFLGKLPEIPFDNQLSLIDKVVFQIENNFKYCPLYIITYLSQLFASHKNLFEPPIPVFTKIADQFENFKGFNDKKEWLNTNKDFLKDLKLLKLDYEANLFEKNYSALLTCIKCKHPLEKHKKEIEYRTRILVSLFRLKGHTKESLDTYISRIISNDEYRFPFPPAIIKIQNKEEYKTSTKKFLESQNFDKQFEGLKNLFIAEHHKSGFFFYAIENCVIDDKVIKDFKVSFEEVTFISPGHNELKKLRKCIRDCDKENSEKTYPIFFGKHKMLAYVHMGYENKDSKVDDGLRIVSQELLSLNQYFEGNLVVNNLHYLVYDSFDSNLWSAKTSIVKVKKTHIGQSDFDKFKNNPYEVLRSNSSPAKALILQSEKVLLKAFARDEVEYYWIFIENIISPLISDSEKIRKAFGKILLKLLDDLKADFLFKIGNMLIPFSFNYKEENLEQKDLYLIHAEIFTNRNFDFDIYQYKNRVRNVFLKDILEYHKTFKSKESVEMWRNHFSSLLLDLYAYRNSLVHSGKINRYSKIKLVNVLPKLISRARWLIINSCKQNEGLGYEELIKKIMK